MAEDLQTILIIYSGGIILITPILILLSLLEIFRKNIFIPYLVINLLTSALLIFLSVGIFSVSDEYIMEYYGYNFDGMSIEENYENVSFENIERVKQLEMSMMGIGRTFKAIFAYIFFIPYILLVYILKFILPVLKLQREFGKRYKKF